MRERLVIICGMGAFLALATFPVWYGFAAGGNGAPPAMQLPTRASNCVESKEWMTANHPKLLSQWRDAVVRGGGREYTSKTHGTRYEMNLTKTCIGCHGGREAFCDRCHDYVNVSLDCWSCHLGSTGNRP
jgi:hypothetical protein